MAITEDTKTKGFSLQSGPHMSTELDVERLIRKREAALGYRIMASWGWGADGSGHITARDPEHTDCFWLLGYGVPFGEATVDDLVLVNESGDVVEGALEINPAAFYIHAPIHASRPDVVGAIHAHTPYGTPFAALATPLTMTSQEAVAFHELQGVFDGEELNVTDFATGQRIADALGEGRLVVLANHGLLTVGTSVASAVGFYLNAERAAEVCIKAPQGREISSQSASEVHESVGKEINGWHVFQWLIRSRINDPSVVG
ncbi:MAG: class II aldolase/adducin family protein [Actinomycetota bacterium]|jgi:ribulose-5-phosphate 4-epimerase/fuculose-1-phosphate aldolase|nr:class II aldolase/adducin family protein [Actinomycetota bacterium]MEC9059112.1 class II aldolase/adducin family protein [Actinomycetota bacterium]